MTSMLSMSVPTTAAEMEPQLNAPPTSIQNPLEDPVLQAYLNNLAVVKNARGFKGWRKAFLERLETFLEPEGVKKATVAYKDLKKNVTRMMSLILQLKALYSRDKKKKNAANAKRLNNDNEQQLEDDGKQWFSVKARRCLSELTKEIKLCTENLDALIPGTMAQEQIEGFTKFQMGAVLLRDQFSQHNRLLLCVDSLVRFEELLQDVADKQTLKIMEMFRLKFQIFCDIMADLGLFAAMQKCLEMDCEEDEAEEEESVDTTLSSSTVDCPEIAMPIDVVEEPEVPLEPEVPQEMSHEPEVTQMPVVTQKPDVVSDDEEEEVEVTYHCSFCRMAVLEGFDRSIFCRGSKEVRAQSMSLPSSGDVNKDEKMTSSPRRSKKKSDLNKTEAELNNSLSSLQLTTPSSPSAKERKERALKMSISAVDMNLSSEPSLSQVIPTTSDSNERISLSEKLSSEKLNSPSRGMMIAKDAIMSEESEQSEAQSKMDKEKYHKLFKWYSRMGNPNRETMKKKIAKVQETKDLTPQDVDELPWVNNGLRVDVIAMNKLIYGSSKGGTSKQLRAEKESL